MFSTETKRGIYLGLILSFLAFFSPVLLRSENEAKGNIIGFLYEQDGATPIEGAKIKVKNIATGSIYESTPSDNLGIFKIMDVEKGIYIYGVRTPKGDFNAASLLGLTIKENETVKVSIAVDPFGKDVAAEMTEIYKQMEANGEALIGRVEEFNPQSGEANVFLLKGYFGVDSRIHAKGQNTEFYQDVRNLKNQGAPAKRLFSGQTATLKLKQKAEKGDMVYLVKKKGVLPMFLAPLGAVSVIAATSAVVYGEFKPNDDPPKQVSPFKK